MSLPSPKRLRAGRQMLVELCEIPVAGALETLRSEAYLEVRCNDEGPASRQGRRRSWAVFSNLLGVWVGFPEHLFSCPLDILLDLGDQFGRRVEPDFITNPLLERDLDLIPIDLLIEV